MQELLTQCPCCHDSDMVITSLVCPACGIRVEGEFRMPDSPFQNLTPEQEQFMLNYIRCEGRFNRLEEELNLSYPTLRNRLNELIVALGFEPGKDGGSEEPERTGLSAEERKAILEALHNGELSFEEAQTKLRGEG